MTVFLLFASVSLSASAATIARWTPAQASKQMRGKCVGVGKPVAGKYAAFRCKRTDGIVWAKVRTDAAKLCWSRTSLAAVSPVCMIVPGHG